MSAAYANESRLVVGSVDHHRVAERYPLRVRYDVTVYSFLQMFFKGNREVFIGIPTAEFVAYPLGLGGQRYRASHKRYALDIHPFAIEIKIINVVGVIVSAVVVCAVGRFAAEAAYAQYRADRNEYKDA